MPSDDKNAKAGTQENPNEYRNVTDASSTVESGPDTNGDSQMSAASSHCPGIDENGANADSTVSSSNQTASSSPRSQGTISKYCTVENNSKEKTVTMSSRGAKPKSVKKVYHVPSRYMSSQEKSQKSPSKKVSQDMSSNSSGSQSFQGKSFQFTSTPLVKGKVISNLDASAVTDAQGHLALPSVKERIVPTKRNPMKQKMLDTTVSHGPVIASHRKKDSKFDERRANAEIAILQAEYLQSVFLEQQARMTLEARSAAAVKTLHKLMKLVTMYLRKVKSQKVLLKVLTILTEWNDHCHKQHEMLKPIMEIIPSLEEKYKRLAEAVNATKHKLLVKDVILPDSDVVQKSLLEMCGFLKSFFEELPNYENIISSSNDLQKYIEFGELLAKELDRGVSLLMEAQDLAITEASLALGLKNF